MYFIFSLILSCIRSTKAIYLNITLPLKIDRRSFMITKCSAMFLIQFIKKKGKKEEQRKERRTKNKERMKKERKLLGRKKWKTQ